MTEDKLNPLTDTTRFVNKDDEPFDIYIASKLARHLEAGEEQVMPVFVAKVGAKHLIDMILQNKGIRDTMTPSPERNSLLAEILPDIGKKVKAKILTEEEYRKAIDEKLAKQEKDIKALGGAKVDTEEIKDLKKQIKKLEKKITKK